jgi:MFS family permease
MTLLWRAALPKRPRFVRFRLIATHRSLRAHSRCTDMASDAAKYELRMVAILCLVAGLMVFEQASVFYLMPFIRPALRLTNGQVGALASAYWVTFAMSSYATSQLVDRLGNRKRFLLVTVLLISIFSVSSSLATSFAFLLAARAVMGFLEGPLFPIAQSIVALESPAKRRGTNMGIVGNLGPGILQGVVAPLVLVKVATAFGWRVACLLVIVPGIICAGFAAVFLRDPRPPEHSAGAVSATGSPPRIKLLDLLGNRNVWLCAIACCLYIAYTSLSVTFLPIFYVEVRHFTSQQMSFVMGLVGVAIVVSAIVVPMASDRIGRKPTMVIASLLGVLTPLASVYYQGPLAVLLIAIFVGCALWGTGSVLMATIPSETVPPQSISTTIGLIISLGVLVGGLAGPALAGWCADHWSLKAPLLLQAACALAAAAISLALRETLSRKVSDPTAQRLAASS